MLMSQHNFARFGRGQPCKPGETAEKSGCIPAKEEAGGAGGPGPAATPPVPVTTSSMEGKSQPFKDGYRWGVHVVAKIKSGGQVDVEGELKTLQGDKLEGFIQAYQAAGGKIVDKRGEKAGQGEGEKASGVPAHGQTKMWRGLEVDAELKDEWLVALNEVPEISIISVDAGHPGGESKQAAGAAESPGYNFNINGSGDYAKGKADEFAERLRDVGTDVTITYWGGPVGNWATHTNGRPRLDVFKQEEIDKYPMDRVSVSVDSRVKHTGKNQDELGRWWESTISALRGGSHKKQPSTDVRKALKDLDTEITVAKDEADSLTVEKDGLEKTNAARAKVVELKKREEELIKKLPREEQPGKVPDPAEKLRRAGRDPAKSKEYWAKSAGITSRRHQR